MRWNAHIIPKIPAKYGRMFFQVPHHILTYNRAEYGKISGVSQGPNIHIFVGEDDYLANSAAAKIVEAAVEPSLRATAVETIDGAADNAETQLASVKECVASIQTPPFLDPVKLTWWRGVTFLPGGGRGGEGKGVSEQVKAALARFAEDLAAHPLPPNQTLVITASRLLKTSVFAKTLLKCGAQLVEFSSGGGKSRDRMEAALMRLPDLAEAEGLKFDPGADAAFISKVGADTRRIVSELAKLRTYLGGERSNVTAADVAEVSSPGGDEPELWEITDAIAQRSPAKLLATISRFDDGKSGFDIMLATVAEKFFRELYIYRDALDRGWLTPYSGWARNIPPDVVQDLDAAGVGPNVSRGDWAVKRGAKNAKAFTLGELRLARFLVLQAREKLVSSGGSTQSLVAQELLRAIMRRPAPVRGRS